ncbi:MAG: hypothetical protein ACI9SI_001464 [Polaribacter sp.]
MTKGEQRCIINCFGSCLLTKTDLQLGSGTNGLFICDLFTKLVA